ncbi:MAG TPA: DUF2207 domain-containing protein, partial [Armatimonadetes bacterium]|nr:DUF2207 domain-containing protein [Armatimonadota bacterium]
LHGMFGASVDNIVRLSDLKNRFYVHLDRVVRAVYRELTISKRLFAMNPKNVRVIFRSIAMMLWFAGFLSLTISWLGAPFAIGLGIAGGVVWLLAPLMPRKTRRGAQVARHILGFKEFIERVEKDRIERMAKEDPTLFDRVLPYAIVLGVADEWAEKFRDLLREPPSWYESTDWAVAPFYAPRFIHEFGRGLHTMGSTFTSAPSGKGAGGGFSGFGGGGGGFSGGGFGGGGGGAW